MKCKIAIAFLNFFACLIISHNVLSQQFVDAPLRKLGVTIVDVLNSNDNEVRHKFISENFDKPSLEKGLDDWLRKFDELYKITQGVNITDIKQGRDSEEVCITGNGKQGRRIVEISARVNKAFPDKLINFMYRPQDGPSPRSWPEGILAPSSIIAEIEKHVEQAVHDDKFSGTLLIAKDDHIIFDKAYGFANREKGVRNQVNTKFIIGSVNKMFTSVAIAQLVQAGKLSFDDKLITILPDYPNRAIAEKITVAHLLTHTSGLGNFFKPEFFENLDRYEDLKSYLPLFANDPISFEPGERWGYSNAGFLVLGLIIEKVSGETYFDYVNNHINKPAGMKNTGFCKRGVTVPDLAISYDYDDGSDPLHNLPRKANEPENFSRGSSAGGGYCTTGDLFRFSRALLENLLLNESLTKSIITGKVKGPFPNTMSTYGLKERMCYGKRIVGHGGGVPGVSASFNMIMENGYTVIALSNYSSAADVLAEQICDFLVKQ
jgi:D-alanyl-D-alanine carboxypeptidase